jgi:hypothetical protein
MSRSRSRGATRSKQELQELRRSMVKKEFQQPVIEEGRGPPK